MSRFSATITTAGNPDYDQHFPITEPESFFAPTYALLVAMVCEHQGWESIGAGNWLNPIIYKDGSPIGYMSYNGRAWELGKSHPDSVEVFPDN